MGPSCSGRDVAEHAAAAHQCQGGCMQERLHADLRALPWEVYFFEDGGWVLLESFGAEHDAVAYRDALCEPSELSGDYYALIGPNDSVMPLGPASFRQ